MMEGQSAASKTKATIKYSTALNNYTKGMMLGVSD